MTGWHDVLGGRSSSIGDILAALVRLMQTHASYDGRTRATTSLLEVAR